MFLKIEKVHHREYRYKKNIPGYFSHQTSLNLSKSYREQL